MNKKMNVDIAETKRQITAVYLTLAALSQARLLKLKPLQTYAAP